MPNGERTYSCVRLSTMLTLPEQSRVDAAGLGLYKAHHRAEPEQVLADVKDGTSSLVLVSVRYCETASWKRVCRVIREMPRVPTIAILSEQTRETPGTLLRLGQEGVQEVIDVRSANGWERLRRLLLDEQPDRAEALIIEMLRGAGSTMSDECDAFFRAVIRYSIKMGSVRQVARVLQVVPSTLMSRFYRAGLPTPKRYLAVIRLVRAAYLFENPGFSIANVANHLEYSSPQSFGRHVRNMMGMSALEFRKRFTGQRMFEMFHDDLIGPYLKTLSWFKPFSGSEIRMTATATSNEH